MKFKNYSDQKITVINDEFIRVDSTGIITTESSIQNFLKIYETLVNTGLNKLLLNTKFENNLTIDQLFEIIQRLEYDALPLMYDISIAVVPLPARHEEFQVFVTSLKDLNLDIELFRTLEPAIIWLKTKA